MSTSKQTQDRRSSTDETLLSVHDLRTYYQEGEGDVPVRAVDGVDFEIARGETYGLVGESGCGKSTLGLSLIRALPPQGDIVDGEIRFDGREIGQLPKSEVKDVQWADISMIYQGAQNAFNPVKTVGKQIEEPLRIHDTVPEGEREARVAELLEMVNLQPDVAEQYPHELSGGMKQRAAIAMAIACEPDLLIADEPTTALDVIVQAEVLNMLQRLQDELEFGMLVISHNLAAIMKLSDRIGVMYGGKLVETAPSETLYEAPRHPYTARLLQSLIDPRRPPDQVETIEGTPPDLRDPPSGCRFAERCELATSECTATEPPLEPVGKEHETACFHHDKVSEL
ncbi:ABC transporter ATP-binding protein [Salinirubellus salinus]|uniref:ABC transporter ATP-binding protein n=1 Tax=Salinirubellus salinus TaxID=1364945 RepID=A0A9E7R6P4_9EURY|nr:ABC transporter ATP-binding protein [Salinirubellus salinus]UWM56834.1 ABC transporter ATP-binding protein [Salinirubellus salinus]